MRKVQTSVRIAQTSVRTTWNSAWTTPGVIRMASGPARTALRRGPASFGLYDWLSRYSRAARAISPARILSSS